MRKKIAFFLIFICNGYVQAQGDFAEIPGVNFEQMNEIIKSFDQVKLMKSLGCLQVDQTKRRLFTLSEANFKTSTGDWFNTGTGVLCESYKLDLSDASCRVLDNNIRAPQTSAFLQQHGVYSLYGESYGSSNLYGGLYETICNLIPGEYDLGGTDCRKFAPAGVDIVMCKPPYMGMTCVKRGYSGH